MGVRSGLVGKTDPKQEKESSGKQSNSTPETKPKVTKLHLMEEHVGSMSSMRQDMKVSVEASSRYMEKKMEMTQLKMKEVELNMLAKLKNEGIISSENFSEKTRALM